MKKSIRCFISCILPCGALDVVRIVHSDGRVEEITGKIKARDVMKAHPKHVLKKPSSPNILIVPPDAELQRGKIYFLMPLPPQTRDDDHHHHKRSNTMQRKERKKKNGHCERRRSSSSSSSISVVSHDGYLNDILSEKLSTQRDRRRGRVAVWRPRLESISESSPCDL